jgi:hypothetical protein
MEKRRKRPTIASTASPSPLYHTLPWVKGAGDKKGPLGQLSLGITAALVSCS